MTILFMQGNRKTLWNSSMSSDLVHKPLTIRIRKTRMAIF